MEYIYHYREQHPKDKLWERMECWMNEDEAAYCPFSYFELFAWICGQLVICDHANESQRHIMGVVHTKSVKAIEDKRCHDRRDSPEDRSDQ